MEKYGVVTDLNKTKTASVSKGQCPNCKGKLNKGATPHCSQCGTRPFEKGKDG